MQAALLYLVNRVMSAGRLSPGQTEALELATLHATSTVALGLEYVSNGDVERAVGALRSISLTRLHRLGYSLTLRLARFARMIAARAITAGQPSLTVLEAILGRRPFYPVLLDNEGTSDLRPIESRQDLGRIANHLQELALRIAIADALGVDLDALAQLDEPRPNLDDYVRTALFRASLGDELSASPLRAEELSRFRDALNQGGMSDDKRSRAQQLLVTLLDEAGVSEARESLHRLVSSWLDEIVERFADLPLDTPIDSKFIDGLVMAGGMD